MPETKPSSLKAVFGSATEGVAEPPAHRRSAALGHRASPFAVGRNPEMLPTHLSRAYTTEDPSGLPKSAAGRAALGRTSLRGGIDLRSSRAAVAERFGPAPRRVHTRKPELPCATFRRCP